MYEPWFEPNWSTWFEPIYMYSICLSVGNSLANTSMHIFIYVVDYAIISQLEELLLFQKLRAQARHLWLCPWVALAPHGQMDQHRRSWICLVSDVRRQESSALSTQEVRKPISPLHATSSGMKWHEVACSLLLRHLKWHEVAWSGMLTVFAPLEVA